MCIVPILTDDSQEESYVSKSSRMKFRGPAQVSAMGFQRTCPLRYGIEKYAVGDARASRRTQSRGRHLTP